MFDTRECTTSDARAAHETLLWEREIGENCSGVNTRLHLQRE